MVGEKVCYVVMGFIDMDDGNVVELKVVVCSCVI